MEWPRGICTHQGKVSSFGLHQTPHIYIALLLFRVGLVEARVVGARVAEGDVIVILDAHCECVSCSSSVVRLPNSDHGFFLLFRSPTGYRPYSLESL